MSNLANVNWVQVCAILNDFVDKSLNLEAAPTQAGVAWLTVYPQGKYPFTENEAFQRLTQNGYNPQALLKFATEKAKGDENTNE